MLGGNAFEIPSEKPISWLGINRDAGVIWFTVSGKRSGDTKGFASTSVCYLKFYASDDVV